MFLYLKVDGMDYYPNCKSFYLSLTHQIGHNRKCCKQPKNKGKMSLVMRKPAFCICENKDADQLRGNREGDLSFAVTAKLISAFVFATRIVHSLYFLNLKFQASSHLLWLCRLVCVGPDRKPRRPVFSERGSNIIGNSHLQ